MLLGGGLIASAAILAGLAASRRSRRSATSIDLLAGARLDRPERPDRRTVILAAAGLPGSGGSTPRRPSMPVLACLVAATLGGAGWALVRSPPGLGPLDGRSIRFEGTAASDSRPQGWGWTVEIRLARVWVDDRPVDVSPKVWATGSDVPRIIAAGQPVVGGGVLEAVPRPADGFDGYLVGKGITGRLRLFDLVARGPPRNPALRLANAVRDAFRRGVRTALPPRTGGLLRGLAIGDTDGMNPEVEEDFRASGLSHLLAVSGSNVAVVIAPVLALASRFGLRPGRRAVLGAAAVGLFALVTRWEPSVLRASAMAAIALAALWSGRPRRVGPALAVAVLGLLVLDPGLAGSLGFQLSVAATAALGAMAGPMTERLPFLPRPVAAAAAATIAAQVGATPLLLLAFGTVPTVTLLANVLAFPAVGPALLLGTVAAAVAGPWPAAGRAVGQLANLPLDFLVGLADRTAGFPLPSVTGGAAAAAVAAVVGVLAARWVRRGGRRTALIALAVVAALAWSSAPGAGPPRSLTVTFLDVGQGDAAVVRTPEGATVLVDAGPEEDDVAVDLAELGVERIDVAVASHAHADHVEGYPAVLARFPVGVLLDPGCPGDSPSYARFRDAVGDEEVTIRSPRGGDTLTVGRLRIDILGPDRCSPGGASPNDDSLVLRLSYGEAAVLFPGDAEVPAQQDLLADGDPVQATVLKVPHHGGDTSDPGFFDAVDAAVAVVSTGPNEYGHPVPEVLAALRSEGMVVYRTDQAGDVTVSFEADGSPVVASAR
jgi:competence protein ComEC